MNEDLTITIAESRIEKLDHEIKKLNKRARKLGCPELHYVTHDIEYRENKEQAQNIFSFYGKSEIGDRLIAALPKLVYHTIELIGEGPVIDGYKFVGTLDHFTVEGSVIVKTVPGEEIPKNYWTAAAVCDHCDTQRYRKETFIFQHEDGTYKQVGRSCIKDFFGHDPLRLLRLAQYAYTLAGEEDEKFGGYSNIDEHYNSQRTLEITAAVIRTFGWVSKGKCREDQIPTSEHVSYAMNPPRSDKERKDWRDFIDSIDFDKDQDESEAKGAVEWLAEQESKNEYIHNLKAIASSETGVTYRTIGLWVSLVSSYQRAQERLEYAARLLRINKTWGEIKKRAEVNVTLESVMTLEGNEWGATYMHKFLTDEGHSLIWFGTTGHLGNRGEKFTIKATVKKFDEYKNWAQTIVTRVAVIT